MTAVEFTLLLAVLIVLATCFGSVVFLSFVMAPAVFRALDVSDAGAFLRTVFPRYFKLALGCSALAVVGLLTLRWWFGPIGGAWMVATISAALMAVSSFESLRLVPRINAARNGGAAETLRFDRLHRRSVILNGALLLFALTALTATVRALTGPSG